MSTIAQMCSARKHLLSPVLRLGRPQQPPGEGLYSRPVPPVQPLERLGVAGRGKPRIGPVETGSHRAREWGGRDGTDVGIHGLDTGKRWRVTLPFYRSVEGAGAA